MKRFSDSRSSRCCLALILLFFFNVGTSTADSTPEYTLQCEGIVRTYRLHIPDELPENAPLVIVLHGYGNPRPGVLNETADRHRFAVCYPQGEKDNRGKACWNVGYPFQQDMTVDDVEFLSQLVHHLQLKHGFSKRNVFCVGMSNGGEMCYQLAAQRPGLFAAVAPISGLMLNWLYLSDRSTVPVPLFEIHGTEDKTSVWEGDPHNSGGWGEYLPVPLAVHHCVARNRCTTMHADTVVGKAPNHRQIVRHRFSGGLNGSEVWLHEVVGAGHSWFWEDMDTGEELWSFFSRFVKND